MVKKSLNLFPFQKFSDIIIFSINFQLFYNILRLYLRKKIILAKIQQFGQAKPCAKKLYCLDSNTLILHGIANFVIFF